MRKTSPKSGPSNRPPRGKREVVAPSKGPSYFTRSYMKSQNPLGRLPQSMRLYYCWSRCASERGPSCRRKQQSQNCHKGHHHDAVVDGIQLGRRTRADGQRCYTEQDASEGERVGREGGRPVRALMRKHG